MRLMWFRNSSKAHERLQEGYSVLSCDAFHRDVKKGLGV